MNSKTAILIIAVVVGAGFLIVSLGSPSSETPTAADTSSIPETAAEVNTEWETKIDDQLPVTIKITPLELGKDSATWKFQITLDTHAGSLDDDLTKVSTLIDDKDNTYKPLGWEGDPVGGHHRAGIISFEPIEPVPSYIELRIKKVGGISDRSFRWDLTAVNYE